jgi:hypothetical protein
MRFFRFHRNLVMNLDRLNHIGVATPCIADSIAHWR